MDAVNTVVLPPPARTRLPASLLLVAVQFAVFWPVWQWVAQRMVDVPENRPSAVALVLAAVLVRHAMKRARPAAPRLLLPTFFILLYIGVFHFVPIHIGAGLAAVSLACTLGSIVDARMRPGLAGLLALALPIVPSMQTHIGYPMRLGVTWVAAAWLRCIGMPAQAEGACLRVEQQLLLVDEPCSGVHMLWVGLLGAFAAAGFMGMTLRRTVLCVAAVLCVVFAANVLRSVWLLPFAPIIQANRLVHDAVGIVVYVLAAPCMAWLALRIGSGDEGKRPAVESAT